MTEREVVVPRMNILSVTKHKMTTVRNKIKNCEKDNHVQQVAYSSYHDTLTQICFTCQRVRTNLWEDNND